MEVNAWYSVLPCCLDDLQASRLEIGWVCLPTKLLTTLIYTRFHFLLPTSQNSFLSAALLGEVLLLCIFLLLCTYVCAVIFIYSIGYISDQAGKYYVICSPVMYLVLSQHKKRKGIVLHWYTSTRVCVCVYVRVSLEKVGFLIFSVYTKYAESVSLTHRCRMNKISPITFFVYIGNRTLQQWLTQERKVSDSIDT